MPLPRCFFDISISGIPTGRIVFELFTDVCPKTCQNFKLLCTGEKGEGKTTFKPLHYKGTPIHRIVKGFMIQGGDFENGDGSGGESVYGGLFKDENFKLKHDGPFLLSMANKGPNTNGSQYFITTRPAPHLDGVHVVFGRVVSGNQFVTEIENQKVDSKSRPYPDIKISNCGELVLLKKGKIVKNQSKIPDVLSENDSNNDGSSSSSSSSEEERRKRKRKRNKKKTDRSCKRKRKQSQRKKRRTKKKESSSSSSESSESSSEEPVQGEVVSSTITEGDLPPEVADTGKKSWLYRYSKSPSPVDGEVKKKKSDRTERTRPMIVSSSGRTLKGRGNMRYRTPPPRDYSWKNYQRSPDRDHHSRRSPDRDRRNRRSPDRDRHSRRSPDRNERSPDRDRHNRRSPDRNERSPDRDRHNRRSPDRDRDRSPDRHHRSPDRHQRSSDRIRYSRRSPDPQRSPDRVQYSRKSPNRDHHHSQRSPDRERIRSHDRSHDKDDVIQSKRGHRDNFKPRTRSRSKERARRSLSPRDKKRSPIPSSPTKEKMVEADRNTTPPHIDQEKYWSDAGDDNHLEETVSHLEETSNSYRRNRHSSKWDRGVVKGSGSSSDEDNELESAYQKVEQTLAEQQFGITALIGEHLK